MKLRIKKGDNVTVLSGADKGRTGKVLLVDLQNRKAIVEGVKKLTHFHKKSQQFPQGQIEQRESFINFSKLALCNDAGEKVKLQRIVKKGKVVLVDRAGHEVRILRKSVKKGL